MFSTRAYQNLSNHYYVPYQVLEQLGCVAYKLLLPDSIHIHHVLHVSVLKLYYQPQDTIILPTIELPLEEGVATLKPQQIMETRWVK